MDLEKRVQLLEWLVKKLMEIIAMHATKDQIIGLNLVGAEANKATKSIKEEDKNDKHSKD